MATLKFKLNIYNTVFHIGAFVFPVECIDLNIFSQYYSPSPNPQVRKFGTTTAVLSNEENHVDDRGKCGY